MKAVPESRRCKRGCCWNNFSTCGRKYTCTCHTPVNTAPPRLTLDHLLAMDDE